MEKSSWESEEGRVYPGEQSQWLLQGRQNGFLTNTTSLFYPMKLFLLSNETLAFQKVNYLWNFRKFMVFINFQLSLVIMRFILCPFILFWEEVAQLSVINLDIGAKRLGIEIHGHCLDKLFKFPNLNFIICKMGIILLTSQSREGCFHVWNQKMKSSWLIFRKMFKN